MVWLIGAFLISAVVTALIGLFLVPLLREVRFGQSIREDGPKWHLSKQGTPTMGGLMFIIGIIVAVLCIGYPSLVGKDYSGIIVLLFSLAFGAIGFIDDYFKVIRKQNLGLTVLQKFVLQLAVAASLLSFLRYLGYTSAVLYIPFAGVSVSVSWLIFMFLALIYIVGLVNAVNLTDGVDGLVTGVTIPVAMLFGLLALIWSKQGDFLWSVPVGYGIFAAALSGGLIGFLLYNYHPAKVFMGDTGSLFLGGAVCGLAFVADAPLILIPVGAIYLIEMFSVVLQVIYFKATKGKRLFLMAPIHHHLEMKGWSEKKLFYVALSLSALLCTVSYIFVAGRYVA